MVAAPHERLVDLVPFEPDNDVHIAELTRQRKVSEHRRGPSPASPFRADFMVRQLCGWNLNAVEGWRDKVRSGDKVSLAW